MLTTCKPPGQPKFGHTGLRPASLVGFSCLADMMIVACAHVLRDTNMHTQHMQCCIYMFDGLILWVFLFVAQRTQDPNGQPGQQAGAATVVSELPPTIQEHEPMTATEAPDPTNLTPQMDNPTTDSDEEVEDISHVAEELAAVEDLG